MSFSHLRPRSVQFEQTFAPFLNDPGLPFAEVLPATAVEQAFAEAGIHFGSSRRSVFTPALTLWAFLSQVVQPAKSCSAAVLRVATLLVALEGSPCAIDTAAYCRARGKLPAAILRKLALQLAAVWRKRHPRIGCGKTGT